MPQPKKNDLKPLDININPVGKNIQIYRKKRGLTQLQLAEKIGITRGLVSAYESGRIHIYDEMIIRFAIALKTTSDELLGISKKVADKEPALRYMKRIKRIEELPPAKQKKVLQSLDLMLDPK